MACKEALKSVKCETGNVLFARLRRRPSIDALEPALFASVLNGDVIEISGEANSGKTELLYHFIARCIFPISWNGLKLNGLNAGVIFIDNDYHFNLFRLITILENRITLAKSCSKEIDFTSLDIASFIRERLRLLNIVKCCSSEQLIITLYSLEDLLGSNCDISVIMVDSISAFHWSDKMNVMNQWKKVEEHYNKLVTTLEKLVQSYSLTLFATKHSTKIMEKELNTEVKQIGGATSMANEDYEVMGRQWQKLVTCRLGLCWNNAEKRKTLVTVQKSCLGKKELKNCVINDAGFQFS